MRLNPALEETGRHRQADRSVLDRLQVHAGKPARIDVVTDLGAQTPLHPSPALLIHVRHFIVSLPLEVSNGLSCPAWRRRPPTRRRQTQHLLENETGRFSNRRALTPGGTRQCGEMLRLTPWAEVSRKKLDRGGE